jgi:predicted nucleic acid-binding protein
VETVERYLVDTNVWLEVLLGQEKAVKSTKQISNSRIDEQVAYEENRIKSLVQEQFLKGYAESDAIYDE